MAHLGGFFPCMVLVILCSLYFVNVRAIKCYSTSLWQNDTVVEETCPIDWKACFKSISTGGNYTLLSKGCSRDGNVTTCGSAYEEPYTTETCYCITDLCNSAGKTGAYSLTGFGVIAAVIYHLV